MFFYNLGRNNKMPGCVQEIRYINRDENTHLWLFGLIINELRSEKPALFDNKMIETIKKMIKNGVDEEISWGKYVIGDDIEGLTNNMIEDYIKYLGNKRSEELGLGILFQNHVLEPESMKWVDKISNPNLIKTDFFEAKPSAYSKSSVIKDDL